MDKYRDISTHKCFLCEATVEARGSDMTCGRKPHGQRGRLSTAEKETPGRFWACNGLTEPETGKEALFSLCPSHQELTHYRRAWKWAEEQTRY